jgi:hypothetical protein
VSDVLDTLERLLSDVAAHAASAPVAGAWATAPAPLAAVAIDPWDDGATGGADVRFAPGEGPTVAALAARFGALDPAPRLPEGTLVLRGEWWREGLPVRVILLLRDPPPDGEPVEELRVQRGLWPPGG